MRHSEKIENIIEVEIKKRKVMKMSQFIVEIEKRRFCEEVTKYAEEKKNKIDPFFIDNDDFIYQNAKRTKDYFVVIGTNRKTMETFYFKQFRSKSSFENEKQILHLFKPNQQNPFLDLIQMDNSRMLLKKCGEIYSLIDYAHSIKHGWDENELLFIFESLLRIGSLLKGEGIYLGDYNLSNISLKETSKQSGKYTLTLINADKATQKKGVISYSLENETYIYPLLKQKVDHLSAFDMEACDIWSMIRCITLLISGLDETLYPNDLNSMYSFLEQQVKQYYPLLHALLSITFGTCAHLLQNSYSSYNNKVYENQQILRQQRNQSYQVQQMYQGDDKAKHYSFQGVLEDMDGLLKQTSQTRKWNQLQGLVNKKLKQDRPLAKLNEQVDLYQFLMKANLYGSAGETIERVIQASNSMEERGVLLLNLDQIYCQWKIGLKFKGEVRLNELESSIQKYIGYDFEMLFKYTLVTIAYDKSNIPKLFAMFPSIISQYSHSTVSHHYLFYLLHCQLVYRYLQQGKTQLGLMYNQIAIDYAYDHIIHAQNNQHQGNPHFISNISKQINMTHPTFDNFTEQREDIFTDLIQYERQQDNQNGLEQDYSNQIKQKLEEFNLGVCEDNMDLIGQYLFLMEEYELAVDKISDLQTRAACYFYQEKYLKATSIYEGLKDMIHFQYDPSIYLALVMCYYFMHDYEKAYSYCLLALNICDKQDKTKLCTNFSDPNLDNNKIVNTKFTKGEEELYRQYKVRLQERNKTKPNQYRDIQLSSQKQVEDNQEKKQLEMENKYEKKQEKKYEKIYEGYNLKASIVVLKAFCEIEIGRVDQAIENMKYAIDNFQRVGLVYEKIDMLENLAFAYFKQSYSSSSSKQALEISLQGYNSKLQLMQQTGRISIELDFPDTLNIISLSYLYMKDIKNAIKHGKSSLELLVDCQDKNKASDDQQLNIIYKEDEDNTQHTGGYFGLLWRQYLYIALLYDNACNYNQVISYAKQAVEMIKHCEQTVWNGEEEAHLHLLIGHTQKSIQLFQQAITSYIKAADIAQILPNQETTVITTSNNIYRFPLLHIQCLSFTLSVYTSEEYDCQPQNGQWCAQKLESVLLAHTPQKNCLLPKYFLQLSQYLDLINHTPKAIELAKTAALLHSDIFPIPNQISQNEIKTKCIIYNTLIAMLQSSKRFSEAESYLVELQNFS